MTEQLTFGTRLKHAWNAFRNREPTYNRDLGPGSWYSPSRNRLRGSNEQSIINSIYNRLAIDVSSISVRHVRLDQNGIYESTIDSPLNYCLNTEANLDQTSRAFMIDVCMSLFDEGCIAIVPVETSINPKISGAFDVHQLRVGKIKQWYPQDIRVEVYNEYTGLREEIIMPKRATAIIENPLYSVMNEPNGTLRRLIRKLNLLDAIDEQSSAGKLDIIMQLPYVIKTPQRRAQAEERRKDIEQQLAGSKYGIAYVDGTERITQLNRPAENNLMAQIEYLTSMLFSQLGTTKEVFDGTADEKTMLNYNNRSVEPMLSAIVDEMKRKFLTKTARTQRQSLMYFREPFRLVPVSEIANIADKFTRNEVLSPNEVRAIVGYAPSKDPTADELRNRNINKATQESTAIEEPFEDEEDIWPA